MNNGINYTWKRAKGDRHREKKRYKFIYMPSHPRANSGGTIAEHIVILEAKLGRPLAPNEQTHHINGNTFDNRPENLEVVDKEWHRILHHRIEMEGRICSKCGADTTFIRPENKRPHWYGTKGNWICFKCYNSTRQKEKRKK